MTNRRAQARPPQIRLVWDENLSPRVPQALRLLGYRASYIGHPEDDQPGKNATDAEIVAHAIRTNQVIVTANHDMMQLCAEAGQRFVWLDPRGRQLKHSHSGLVERVEYETERTTSGGPCAHHRIVKHLPNEPILRPVTGEIELEDRHRIGDEARWLTDNGRLPGAGFPEQHHTSSALEIGRAEDASVRQAFASEGDVRVTQEPVAVQRVLAFSRRPEPLDQPESCSTHQTSVGHDRPASSRSRRVRPFSNAGPNPFSLR